MSSTTSGNITILLPSRVPQSESELISGATSEFKAVTGVKIVSPGEVVSTDTSGYLKGHGTMVSEDGKYIVATVAGVVERVNKLLTVRPLKSRYFPSVGDVVVGRVVEVGNKRWKVDLQGRQNASLLLSAVYLPGGVQRRKTEEDLLQMRQLFTEQDVIVAEVQQIYHDSHIALQTRSARYGRLYSGLLVRVSPALMRRCKQHFHCFDFGVDVILGMNGYIWVQAGRGDSVQTSHGASSGMMEDGNDDQPFSVERDCLQIPRVARERILRVANVIRALDALFLPVSTQTIEQTYKASLAHTVSEIMNPAVRLQICIDILTRSDSTEQPKHRPYSMNAPEEDVVMNDEGEGLQGMDDM